MVVSRGNLLQRQRVGDGDGEGTIGGRGEVGGALLRGGRNVAAAEQAKRDVGEGQRPERQLDHPTDGEQLHVQVGVIGQRTLDDAVDRIGACARIGSTTSGASRSTACTTTDRSTRSRSAVRRAIPSTLAPPSGQLRGSDPTPPRTSTVEPQTGPSPKTAQCAVMPRIPGQAPTSSPT